MLIDMVHGVVIMINGYCDLYYFYWCGYYSYCCLSGQIFNAELLVEYTHPNPTRT